MEMLDIDGQLLRVGRQLAHTAHTADAQAVPLLLFNGIGGNVELLAPIASWMPEREVITFDVPGVGHSPLPNRPYRVGTIARLAARVLAHYGHTQADVLGISWGGGPAQQFARLYPDICRKLILCATSTGHIMVPNHPRVALKMVTPRRYMNKEYSRQVSGDIYGGDFRRSPELAGEFFKHVRWQSRLGYFLQLGAMVGWTSIHWLHRLRQPTLVMAGTDDPLIPLANARIMRFLLRKGELELFDCGHLFLLTRAQRSAQVITQFLNRAV
jgi:poly(3-hydroxyoctanoate) depolymerase